MIPLDEMKIDGFNEAGRVSPFNDALKYHTWAVVFIMRTYLFTYLFQDQSSGREY